MDRRLVITVSFLILTLAVLTVAGLLGRAGTSASRAVRLPQPAPSPMPEQPQALSVPGDASVAWQPLAPAGMSGEFRDLRYASTAGYRAPHIYIPPDRWHFRSAGARHPARMHRAGAVVC